MDKQFIKKVRFIDRIATRVITTGGLLIIGSVIAILLLIFKVALPLFLPSKANLLTTNPLPLEATVTPLAIGIDDYRETAYVLDNTGCFNFFRVADGSLIQRAVVSEQPHAVVRSLDFYKNSNYTILWSDTSATLVKVSFRADFDQDGKRTIVPRVEILERFPPATEGPMVTETQIRRTDEGRVTRLDYLTDQRFAIHHRITTTDLFDNVSTEESDLTINDETPGRVSSFTLNEKGTALFAGTDIGYLVRWDLSTNDAVTRTDNIATTEQKPITALGFVLGDISLAVGDAAGNFTTWMPIRPEPQGNIKKYRPIHQLAAHRKPVIQIIPAQRNKTIMSLDEGGTVFFDHMTSENHLFAVAGDLKLFGSADRGNSLIGIDRNNRYLVWNIDNPHPEANLRTLFGKVWYENYDQPEYVWQSSAASDDFEPKLSIVPLLFGTIKGTLYAMIFAIPLAIFGAVYTSQFTTPAFKKTIKPAIEIMASIPSVVIGFLIALWLAPIVERAILAILLSLIIVPVVFISFLYLYKPLYTNNSVRQFSRGYEFLLLVPVIFLAGAIAVVLAPTIENLLFAGNFKLWLFNDLGMRYDQRNCIIIAFGLGIAVIPIIFSITEDAITNIPPSLSAASLALGASRWQTVWRVVLPSASPGIFAAIMIGFGRAVGETMIVLMATGNTPIMDWSIFNGMRTLSANIAVEIPEAPVGGTLYRVLFLCSTLLFVLTFILNTGADIVRERLRKKYGRY